MSLTELDPALRTELLARWAEPHRRHHDVAHLDDVLRAVAELADRGATFDRTAVDLAAWFHDAIYDIGRDDNEDRSADLARARLAPPELAAEVARLVETTKTHAIAEGDANGAALSDADLAVLGAPPERYAQYAAAVREEYSAIPDEVFRPARARVLAALLDGAMYHTQQGRDLWERRARDNVTAELHALTTR